MKIQNIVRLSTHVSFHRNTFLSIRYRYLKPSEGTVLPVHQTTHGDKYFICNIYIVKTYVNN